MLSLLHTSDWHLGRRLHGMARYAEFEQFLAWQLAVLRAQAIDVLLIAGDIFDTMTPSARAQALYYNFLAQAVQICRHVVIVGGNHDSASFLDAPKTLLKAFNTHVIGSISDARADDLLVLNDSDGVPELIVLAVPYLRDRDIRQVSAGESLADKAQKLVQGIAQHYHEMTELAKAEQARILAEHKRHVPLVGTGHLFAAGGSAGDGVRDLYVGSLAFVGADIFDRALDYVALGHLHLPQTVAGQARIRYSGSPIAMGFGELKHAKSVQIVRFAQAAKLDDWQANHPLDTNADWQPFARERISPTVLLESLHVPVFQRLARVSGDWQTISKAIKDLKKSGDAVWLEVTYQGDEALPDFVGQVDALVADSKLVVLKKINNTVTTAMLQAQSPNESLEDLDVHEVFERRLAVSKTSVAQQDMLRALYAEVLTRMQDDDNKATQPTT